MSTVLTWHVGERIIPAVNGRVITTKLLAILIAVAFLLKVSVGAHTSVLCRHADGSERIEGLVEQLACHGAAESDQASAAAFMTTDCSDETLPAKNALHRTTNSESARVNLTPLPVAVLPWDFILLSTPDSQPLPRLFETFAPAAELHALLLSAVVLLI